MADRYQRATISDLRGGRNGVDPPFAIGSTECVDAVNVEWFQTTVGRKRNGVSASSVLFSTGGPFTGKVSSLHRHVPGTDESLAEQWAVDDALVVGRRAASTSFAAPTLKDSISGNGWDVDWASLNGKLFLAYAASSGFSTPGAPTVANNGSGTYAAVLRYYRVRWIQQSGGLTIRRSPVGTSSSPFTPSGTGLQARVTQPTPPGQGETHWELEVSYDNSSYRVLYGDGGIYAPIAIATTTGDDTSTLTSTTTIDTFTASGTWTRPSWVSSVSYLVVGGGAGGGGTDNDNEGGGGAGGEVKTGTLSSLSAASYSVTVGGGGTAGSAAGADGGTGSDSVFSSVTARGGSGGGGNTPGPTGNNGVNGYLGGGAGGGATGGTGSIFAGGDGATNAGGGGAGAGSVGGTGTSGAGGNGGSGVSSSISGSSVAYGGGGGGGGYATGGTATAGGGAGAALVGNGSAGTANRGGGGGGARFGAAGGAGGTGIVIVSYASLNITSAGTSNADNTDRLHVWDGSTVRRAGFVPPSALAAPTNTGSGAYAATIRYYRTRWTEQSGGVTVRRSEPSSATSFTPSGSGTGAVITRPALASEGETHWELEASADGVTFYVLATTVVATSTYTDSTAVSAYSSGTLSALTGTYTVQKSYRFIAADQGRLIGFGNWTATGRQNDIEVSAVVGSLNIGDAERVDTTSTYKYTLDENDSGKPTGLKGPVFGNFYAWKWSQFWELAPTGQTNNPYRRTPISKTIGCVQRGASCVGEDAQGNAALYFMSHRGMYRYGVGGLTYIGKGIEDYIIGPTATMHLAATKVIAWTLYYPFKRQVWVGWATGSCNDPCQTAIYDVATGGWSRVPTGDTLANIRCAALFSGTVGTSMSYDLKPYLGSASTANVLYKGDDDSVTQDAGTSYQAYVVTRPIEPGGPGFNGSVGDALLLAKTASGVTITATAIPNFDSTNAKTGTALLTATGSETRVTRRLEGSALGNTQFVQYQLGDGAAANNGWTLDRLVIPYSQDEAVSG